MTLIMGTRYRTDTWHPPGRRKKNIRKFSCLSMAMDQITEEKAAGPLPIHPVVPSRVLVKVNPQLQVICWKFFKGEKDTHKKAR